MEHALRPHLISWFERLAHHTGLRAAAARKYGGIGSVVMLHSVVHRPGDWLFQDIRTSCAYVEAILRWLRRSGIDIVDMDTALHRLRNAVPGFFVVMTFDDGYRDNMTKALPIFERYGAPMTVYVTSQIVDRTLFYWWGGLVELFQRHDDVDVACMERRFRTATTTDRANCLYQVARWVERDVCTRAPLLTTTFHRYGITLGDLLDRDALTLAELQHFARHPLVSIGGHGHTHRPLGNLSEREAAEELRDNRHFLEDALQCDIGHFSYPHGDAAACGRREATLVRQLGYRSAVSTRKGNLFPGHGEHPFLLPRSGVNARRERLANFQVQVSGLYRGVVSRVGSEIDPDTMAVALNAPRSLHS